MIECPSCKAPMDAQMLHCGICDHQVTKINGFPAWAPELANSSSGFKPEYFKTLSELEKSNFWFRGRNAIILWSLRRYFPSFKSYLEVGCGTGYVLSGVAKSYPHSQLVGSEIFIEGLSYAQQRVPSAQFVQMDATRIPYREEFDVIGSFDVLEHIKEDKIVLQHMFDALKPGGVLLITVPQHPWLWSASDEYACHERRYTKQDLHKKLYASGFKILRSTSFVSLLLPAMLLSRKKPASEQFDPLDEFRLNSNINHLLEGILSMERKMITLGINFPIGGSRLVVATKQ